MAIRIIIIGCIGRKNSVCHILSPTLPVHQSALVPDLNFSPPGHQHSRRRPRSALLSLREAPSAPSWCLASGFLHLALLPCSAWGWGVGVVWRGGSEKKKLLNLKSAFLRKWFLQHKSWEIATMKLAFAKAFGAEATPTTARLGMELRPVFFP